MGRMCRFPRHGLAGDAGGGMAAKLNRVEVDAMDLVMACRLAGREAQRQLEAAKEDGDAKGVIEAREDSDRVKRLLLAAVGRVEDPVEVTDAGSTAAREEA